MFNVSFPKTFETPTTSTLFPSHSYVALAMAWNTNEYSQAQNGLQKSHLQYDQEVNVLTFYVTFVWYLVTKKS